ncbi:TetR/AcrR family transcriptional regulator [Dactylosporangium cerinum]
MEDRPKRGYVSRLRQDNAEATRLRIAEAARALMLERGYAATTMGDVAAAAGVAVQTLYTACPGGKPGLAKVVYDVTLAGDAQPLPQHARPAVQAIIAEPDPVRKLARYAEMVLTVIQRVGPVHGVLRAAAAATPPTAPCTTSWPRPNGSGAPAPAARPSTSPRPGYCGPASPSTGPPTRSTR